MWFALRPTMRTSACLVAATLVLSSCVGGSADSSDVDDGFAVPGGKEDDFFSLSAFEYILEGRTSVTIEQDLAGADAATKDARVAELIGYRQIAIAWFLTQYLVDKEHDDANAGFGGFGGMAKAGSYEDLDVTAVSDTKYEFTFRQIVAGKEALIDLLPITSERDGRAYFDLAVGTPSNTELAQLETNSEWYRNAPWSGWNPDNVADDKKEVVTFAIERERASTDAWFDYAALFADDQLTIDVHFGWDYHSDYHLKHSRALYNWLRNERDFESPVDSFDDLTRTSGPLTRTIDANGREIQVNVRIFYGKPGSDTDPDTDAGGTALEQDVRGSLATSDAIVYSGHSGPFYGFALGNWRKTEEGDLDDSEMRTVAMPSERYQVVFAEGCDTYQIGEAFRNNPAKPDGAFVDVITTTSFSNASTPDAVQDFISRLIERDTQGRHRPRTVKSLLSDLDSNSYYFHTMYGIHGIDDNPALHPYANPDTLCQSCSTNTDCGGVGNMCIGIGPGGDTYCAPACTDDRGCGDGYTCAAVASQSSGTIYAQACVPTDYQCR